jgi:hypothetical protein
MSAVKGVNKTLIDTGGISNEIAKGLYDARVKAIIDTYEASALASSSTISMGGTLPVGARIQLIQVMWDALSTVTFSVGDSASTARYISGQQGSTAGAVLAALVDGFDYVVGTAAGDNQILISTTGGSAATGTIKLLVLYTQD